MWLSVTPRLHLSTIVIVNDYGNNTAAGWLMGFFKVNFDAVDAMLSRCQLFPRTVYHTVDSSKERFFARWSWQSLFVTVMHVFPSPFVFSSISGLLTKRPPCSRVPSADNNTSCRWHCFTYFFSARDQLPMHMARNSSLSPLLTDELMVI